MKLLTLNTHSLVEKQYPEKLEQFILAICEEMPDIIALQEVNQTIAEQPVTNLHMGYVPCTEGIIIRRDNHVSNVADMLQNYGLEYYWTWLPLKKGYDRYDEGMALLRTDSSGAIRCMIGHIIGKQAMHGGLQGFPTVSGCTMWCGLTILEASMNTILFLMVKQLPKTGTGKRDREWNCSGR